MAGFTLFIGPFAVADTGDLRGSLPRGQPQGRIPQRRPSHKRPETPELQFPAAVRVFVGKSNKRLVRRILLPEIRRAPELDRFAGAPSNDPEILLIRSPEAPAIQGPIIQTFGR